MHQQTKSTASNSLLRFINRIKYRQPLEEEDAIFIDCTKQTLLLNAASFSPNLKSFHEIYKCLSSEGLMKPRLNQKAAALELLHLTDSIDKSFFPSASKLSLDFKLDVLPISPWTNALLREGKVCADIILDKDTKSVSNLNVYKTLATKLPLLSTQDSISNWLTNSKLSTDSLSRIREEVDYPIYVIDSLIAHELDDGISVEPVLDANGNIKNHWLHVHVADPSSHLSPTHPLSILALVKSTSIYLPEQHHSLLPDLGGKFDLKRGGNTVKFSAQIGNDGEILEWHVGVNTTKNIMKMSYEAVDDVLESYKLTVDSDALRLIKSITDKHMNSRLKEGMFNSDQAETRVIIKDDLVYLERNHQTSSRIMVAEAMIIAGRVAAKFCSEHHLVVPYRGQPSPIDAQKSEMQSQENFETQQLNTKNIIQDVLDHRDKRGMVPYANLIKLYPIMHCGVHSLSPTSHFAMGIPGKESMSSMTGYLRTTSPLRRYLDLVAHWQIKSVLQSQLESTPLKQAFTRETLISMVPRIEDAVKKAKTISKTYESSWLIEWCRRRETLYQNTGIDPCLIGTNLHLDKKIQSEDSVIVQSIRKRYDGCDSGIMYTGIIAKTETRNVLNVEGVCSTRDCLILELGKKCELFLDSKRINELQVGKEVKCRVLTADPFSNYLRFMLV